MSMTFLWTDLMVWFLVAVLIIWGWVISRSPQVKKIWHTIFKSKIAMASSIVLLFYLSFTLLDSVHVRFSPESEQGTQGVQYQGEMVSLLDLMFVHNIESTERTYSAPFATHEYAKSIVVDDKGVTRQVNLPLKHVSQSDSFLKESLFALLIGACISFLLIRAHMF